MSLEWRNLSSANKSKVLWSLAWLVFRFKIVSLDEMDLSEIYLIEQEKEEQESFAKSKESWWRRWLI